MRAVAAEALIVAAALWLLLGPSWSIEAQRRMAVWLGIDEPEPPELVMDKTGTLWRWHADRGYVQLVARRRGEQRGYATLRSLEAFKGEVREWGPM